MANEVRGQQGLEVSYQCEDKDLRQSHCKDRYWLDLTQEPPRKSK